MTTFLHTLKIALHAIKTNKTRSFLTSLGIIIGVSSVITLLSIGSGLKNYVAQQFSELGSNLIIAFPGEFVQQQSSYSFTQEAAFFDFKFTPGDVARIKREAPTALAVVPLIRKAATVKYKSEEKTTLCVGTTSDYTLARNLTLQSGRFFTKSEDAAAKKLIVLGAKIAEDLFGSQAPVGQKIILQNSKFKVIGVAEKIGGSANVGMNFDEFVYIPLHAAEKLFDIQKYNSLLIPAPSDEAVPQIKKQVETALLKRLDEDEFSVTDQEELLKTISSILSVFSAALGGIAAISLLVGGIGIMNIMFVSVTERTREIGLRKAVGAHPRQILLQFLTESALLSCLGGLIGILISFGLANLLNRFFPAHITPWAVLLAFAVSASVGILFGVIPSYKAAKLNPIDALRYE